MARTLLITGMSGAGKTQVMRTLEDLGYFCVDNLPPTFIPKFIELCLQNKNAGAQLALVVDIRGGKFFKDLNQVLDQLNQSSMPYELVFLDADDATLPGNGKSSARSGNGPPPSSIRPRPRPRSCGGKSSNSLARGENCLL